MTSLIVYFSASLFVSFLCSLLESVLLSVTHAHIAVLTKEGKKRGSIMARLKEDINRPLSAILTINTIAHTVGAILVGVQAKVAYSELNYENTFFASGISDELLVGFVSTVMTILILLFSVFPRVIQE